MSQGQKTQTTNRIPGINYTKQGNPILTDKTPYQTRQNIVDSYKTLHEQTTRKITELKESAERQVRELEAELQSQKPVCLEATRNCPTCHCRSVVQTGRPRLDLKNLGLTPVSCLLCPYEDKIFIA